MTLWEYRGHRVPEDARGGSLEKVTQGLGKGKGGLGGRGTAVQHGQRSSGKNPSGLGGC